MAVYGIFPKMKRLKIGGLQEGVENNPYWNRVFL
jgi:hypothetical protein